MGSCFPLISVGLILSWLGSFGHQITIAKLDNNTSPQASASDMSVTGSAINFQCSLMDVDQMSSTLVDTAYPSFIVRNDALVSSSPVQLATFVQDRQSSDYKTKEYWPDMAKYIRKTKFPISSPTALDGTMSGAINFVYSCGG